jgi:hypothetical protein
VVETARYRCPDVALATEALLALLVLARETRLDFLFGPLNAVEIVSQGLVVSGDLGEVRTRLGQIPGLVADREPNSSSTEEGPGVA